MLGALKGLVERGVKSIVWLHDGLYVHKGIEFEEVEQRIQEQAEKLGIKVAIRREDLEEELIKERKVYKERHGETSEDGTFEKEGIIREGHEGERKMEDIGHEIVDLKRPYRDPPVRFGKVWEDSKEEDELAG